MHILIAGGAGFIGSAFARLLAKERPSWSIVIYDKLTYAGNVKNLEDLAGRYVFVRGDIADERSVRAVLHERAIDTVVNFAAESHVDRSIMSGTAFARTDVIGTVVLLQESRTAGVRRFVQVSTDEVYGSINEGTWTEESPLLPNSPYSASKAGGDLQVRAAWHTYQFPILITRGSNTYGPYHYPEKVIPLFITNLLEGKKIPLYGDGEHRRDWLFVDDHARGILTVLESGQPGEVYNLGSGVDLPNRELARMILGSFGVGDEWIEFIPDRPGHDRRYALDSTKARELGWKTRVAFPEGLGETIAWYRARPDWWKPLKSGEYLAYYRKQYEERAPVASEASQAFEASRSSQR